MEMSLTKKQSKANKDEVDTLDINDLFHQHWDRICSVLFRLVGDWYEAEDLALDTFIRLHQRPPNKRDNISGWLYRVAINLGLNTLRARKRRQQYEERAGVLNLLERTPDNPAEVFEREMGRQQVHTVLSLIKPRSAKLLVLRYSGFTYAEIAAILKISAGSVGTLLARAEKEFEQVYKKITC